MFGLCREANAGHAIGVHAVCFGKSHGVFLMVFLFLCLKGLRMGLVINFFELFGLNFKILMDYLD